MPAAGSAPPPGRRGGSGIRPAGRSRSRGRDARGNAAHVEATLEPVEASGIPPLAGGAGEEHSGGDQLQLQPRRGRAGHLRQPGVDDIGGAGQRPRPEGRGLHPHPVDLIARQPAQHRRPRLGHGGEHDQVAEAFEDVLDEPARVEPGLDDLLDPPEDLGGIAGRERGDHRVEQLGVGEAEQRRGPVIGQAALAGAGDQLVEHRQRIADRPAPRADHEAEHSRLDRHLLGRAQLPEIVVQPRGWDQPERIVVGA